MHIPDMPFMAQTVNNACIFKTFVFEPLNVGGNCYAFVTGGCRRFAEHVDHSVGRSSREQFAVYISTWSWHVAKILLFAAASFSR